MNEKTAALIKQIQDVFEVPADGIIIKTANPEHIKILKNAGVKGRWRNMAQEIEFRAWDKKLNKFHYWDLGENCFSWFWSMVKANETERPEQFTGARDTENSKIYAGDKVQNLAGQNFVVDWDKYFCRFFLRALDTDDNGMSENLLLTMYERLTITGNIHD